MRSFRYATARSFAEAVSLLGPDAVPLAGGTDLVPLMQERLVQPRLLVDVRRIAGSADVEVTRQKGASIGAMTTLAELTGHPALKRLYPALIKACSRVGTAQIRNVATLGGNLCQRPRCWYYRSGVRCLKSDGSACPARDGMNEYMAILGGGPCWAPHPSDPAVALAALDARIVVRRKEGKPVAIAVEDFYADSATHPHREVALGAEDIIERVVLSSHFAGARQTYNKVTQRQAFDFALVSVGVVWPKRKRKPSIVLGGVAPKPWRIDPEALPPAPGASTRSKALELWTVNVADQALKGAKPLAQNGYKIDMAKALVREALLETFPGR